MAFSLLFFNISRLCGADIIRVLFPPESLVQWATLPRDRSCTVLDLQKYRCVLKLKQVGLVRDS
jgi:hypothetical protein